MKTKKKYDSSIVFLYNTGNENLLPAAFRKKIPYSTICDWRKTDYNKYFGNEYRYLFDEVLDNAILKKKFQEQQKLIRSILRSWISISSTVKPLIKKAGKDKKLQKTVLKAIHSLKETIGIDKALKIFTISRSQYQQWILENRFHCMDSYSAVCVKRHPQQLGIKEVKEMKRLLTHPATDHWPIISIHANTLREKKLIAGKDTWYKYARLLGITKKGVKKPQKLIGLVSNIPNEYLHVDITYYTLIENKKICIAFVMDNYSKMILGFSIGEKREFTVVKKAIENALEVIITHPNHKESILVTDGGTENHNSHIDNFIANLTSHKLTKIRALKDIVFSNSPVEAIHRIIKGCYLRNRQFESIEALNTYLIWSVMDYNELRPHYKHRPRTPFETYFNIPLRFDIKLRMQRARKRRIKKNKCVGCLQCEGTCKITSR